MTDIEAVVTFPYTGEHHRQELTTEEIQRGWIDMPCPECEGTGVYIQPDESEHDCIHCSTSGKVMASLPPLAAIRQRVNNNI